MTKDLIIADLMQEFGLKKSVATRYVNAYFDSLSSSLMENGSISFPNFGTLKSTKIAGRSGYNPLNGEQVWVPESAKITFSMDENFRRECKKVSA